MTDEQRKEFQAFIDARPTLKTWKNISPSPEFLFGIGPGWIPMVQELIDALLKLGWDGTVHQVKEKFGGLRFYVDKASQDVHEEIYQYERQSYTICEECGSNGKLRNDLSWILTLCDKCYEKYGNNQKREQEFTFTPKLP